MDYAKDPEGAAKKILENSFTDVPILVPQRDRQMPEVAVTQPGGSVIEDVERTETDG